MARAADETAALKQSIIDMSKTLALLTAEIAKRPAATALEHLLGAAANPLALPPSSNAPVAGTSSLLREVPDILAFVEAWMIFTSVLQNTHLELPVAQALTTYLGNIVVLSRAYPWLTVLDYHVTFMQAL
ncbi:hypothetical protein DFH08DRAFT_947817 [Mycena albidolilacea]|uniref:Uncharacterized protein n=1 Tax=Mycena albidolilacea TaxID=1033008 RepID=A0AAD7F6X0_9AGAR|nr:hypothetical protein DFH08DRAFT_947817 [Mycena albidolilacea]